MERDSNKSLVTFFGGVSRGGISGSQSMILGLIISGTGVVKLSNVFLPKNAKFAIPRTLLKFTISARRADIKQKGCKERPK